MSRPPPNLLPLLAAEALANLMAVAQRSALALIGIVIGTAAVIAMLDVGHNAEAESIRQFQAMGTDLIIAQGGMSGGQAGLASPQSIEEISHSLPDIRLAAPLSISGMRLGRGEGIQTSVIGSTAALASVIRLHLAEGRFLAPFDQNETFAVIGARLASAPAMAAAPLHPGERIRIGGYLFTIIGVLAETAHNPLLPFDVDTSVVMPIGSIRRVASDAGASSIIASAAEGADPILAAETLKGWLRQMRHGRQAQVQSARQLIEGMQHQARIMAILLAAIGGISLLVGGVGVMNVMLMNVAERRREIGLRLALGARRSHIRAMFLMEAALLSLTGGLCGTVLGMVAAFIYARFSGWDFTPSSLALPLGAVISAGIGLFFGAYPAAAAAALDPIETLRAE